MEEDSLVKPESAVDVEENAELQPPSAIRNMVNAFLAASPETQLLMEQKVKPLLECTGCRVRMLSVPEFISHDCESQKARKTAWGIILLTLSLTSIIIFVVTSIVCPERIPEKKDRY